MFPAYSAELCWTIAACLPRMWLEQERSKPPLQQFAVCCQEVLANLADNVMNLYVYFICKFAYKTPMFYK